MRSSAIGSHPLLLLLCCLLVILAPATTCSATGKGITKPRTKEEAPARIAPPVRMKRRLSPANVKALPAGAHAQFPAYDGDPFYVTLPSGQQPTITAESVRSTLIAAILNSIGFRRGIEALTLPPDQGMKLPRANFKLLMRAVAHEYGVNKELPPDEPEIQELMLGRSKAEGEKDRAFKSIEGVSFGQYTADLEHTAVQYVFRQVDGGVPIEHVAVLASGPEGKGITTVQGAVLNDYRIANRKSLAADKAVQAAIRKLGSVSGIQKVTSQRSEEEPVLVLLPYGSDSAGVTQLRYAYRMILRAVSTGQEGPFLLWLDAENQKILELDPLFAEVAATGIVYNRDPGVGTITRDFEVDPASGGQYTLQLTGVMNRVQYAPNAALDVSISDGTNGSSPTLANFDQIPINDATQALCSSGTNKSFQQVNFFGTIYRYYQTVLGHGIFTPFPVFPWSPQVEVPNYCNANSGMVYGACQGYFDAACPNLPGAFMNFAHDNTVVGHELAHSITPRLTNARPANWCPTPPCPMPVGWWQFHDLADFWADHFESTNCTAGWVAKNLNGVNANLNCAIHDGRWAAEET